MGDELHIHINFRRGVKFTCSKCGKEHCHIRDITQKTWRHLNFFGINAIFIFALQIQNVIIAEYTFLFRRRVDHKVDLLFLKHS